MIIDNIAKIKKFRCFKEEFAGFDKIMPVNIIIGKNNSGKSCLLDFVKFLTSKEKRDISQESHLKYSKKILEDDLSCFNDYIVNKYCGKKAQWELNSNSIASFVIENISFHNNEMQMLRDQISIIPHFLKDKIFCRLLADRDIVNEVPNKALGLTTNGSGATNIIRKYINSSHAKYPRELIQNELLGALNKIFGSDADFTEIQVQEHDESDAKHWEVYLGEKKKGLIPLSKSGSGLKTIILVLLNLLIIPKLDNKSKGDYVYAFEELENNLHPSLLRRLLAYIHQHAITNQCYIFLTTHSSTTLNMFYTSKDAQIIHVRHDGNHATTETIDAFAGNLNILSDIGINPSDLLQANCIVWLEGPSDRIYFNKWIELYDKNLKEGKDYQCAYYGGSILSRCTFDDDGENTSDMANLLNINQNAILITDGDRTASNGKGSRLKKRVQNIKKEFSKLPKGEMWITNAKEIENYIPTSVLAEIWERPKLSPLGQYEIFFHAPCKEDRSRGYWQKHSPKKTFSKVDFASKIVQLLEKPELSKMFELDDKMNKICTRIREWNR